MLLVIITAVSIALAAVMTFVAWRVSREERRRSEARVAALAADIHRSAPVAVDAGAIAAARTRAVVGLRAEPARIAARGAGGSHAAAVAVPARDLDLELRPAEPARPDLFVTASGPAAEAGSRRWGMSVIVGVLALAVAAALVVVFSGEPGVRARAAHASTIDAGSAGTAVATPALELVALGHERDGDALTVRGLVRNPAGGAVVNRLVAVVSLFDREGRFLSSAHTTVDPAAFAPGRESPFVINIPDARTVER